MRDSQLQLNHRNTFFSIDLACESRLLRKEGDERKSLNEIIYVSSLFLALVAVKPVKFNHYNTTRHKH